MQGSLFGTGVMCDHCKTDPWLKAGSDVVWHGFRDADTGQNVCWKCRAAHYAIKNQGEHAWKHSELPVVVAPKN